jgi:glycosyltransferase involved in cell wall biosynthesis
LEGSGILKVLLILPEFGSDVRGGIARFYEHAVLGLRSAGCAVDVCVASADGVDPTKDSTVRGLRPESIMAAERRLSHLSLFPSVKKQLAVAFAAYNECSAGEGYDVVETTDWGLLYLPWLAEASRRCPVVVQLHGSPGQIGYKDPLAEDELSALVIRALEMIYLPRADDLQTSGLANATDWQQILGTKVRRILPAWSVSSASPAPRKHGNFGMVAARLQSWKGPELLCRACRELGEHSPTVLWAGGDHPFQHLGQSMSAYLAATYPDVWGKKIIPLGSQSQEVTGSIQREAKFVVHPSSWDVFGLAVVEAMGAAKVIVCSDQAGVSALIEHEKNGFVYPGHDFHALAELLRRVSNLSSDTLSRIGAAAHDTIASKLNVEQITELRVAAYAELQPKRDQLGHPWVTRVLAPESGKMRPTALLDTMPLRQLITYVGRRVIQRCIPSTDKRETVSSLAPSEVSALMDELSDGGRS